MTKIEELATQYNVSAGVIRYHLRNGKTYDDIAKYYDDKLTAHDNTDVEERINELTATKLGAQIENIRITSSERTLKIEKAIKQLININDVNTFIVKVVAIMKSHRSMLLSELPSKIEGLDADDIIPILQKFENELDALIAKDIATYKEELDDDKNK